jgi:hypothetical protein
MNSYRCSMDQIIKNLLFSLFTYNANVLKKRICRIGESFFSQIYSLHPIFIMFDLQKIEAAINQISAEKKISKGKLVEIIEHAIKTAYKKDYASKDANVNVHLDITTGAVDISIEKEVVEIVEDPSIQISYEEIGGADSGFVIGDMVEIDVSEEIIGSE